MAKLKDLAGLAALGVLGYKLSQGKGDASATDTGDETSRLAARKPAKEEPRRQITDYAKKAPTNAEDSTQSSVLKTILSPKEAPNDQAGNQGILPPKSLTPTPTPTPTPKSTRTGMTGAQNTALAKANQGMSKASITAAKDEDARLGNIKAAKDYNRGRDMEREVLNNMITNPPMKKGGMVKKMASGGMTASRRADGIASRGKTRCKMY